MILQMKELFTLALTIAAIAIGTSGSVNPVISSRFNGAIQRSLDDLIKEKLPFHLYT